MFEFMDMGDDKILAVKVTGKLTHKDYTQVCIPKLNAALKAHNKVRLYVEMHDFAGWDWEAAWDDFKTGFGHRHDIEKLALVGEKAWQEWAVKIFGLMMSGEVQYFPQDQKEAAKAWVKAN